MREIEREKEREKQRVKREKKEEMDAARKSYEAKKVRVTLKKGERSD